MCVSGRSGVFYTLCASVSCVAMGFFAAYVCGQHAADSVQFHNTVTNLSKDVETYKKQLDVLSRENARLKQQMTAAQPVQKTQVNMPDENVPSHVLPSRVVSSSRGSAYVSPYASSYAPSYAPPSAPEIQPSSSSSELAVKSVAHTTVETDDELYAGRVEPVSQVEDVGHILSDASAWEDFYPQGYVDTRVRMGSERALGSTEVFYPFGWNGKYLGFADIRLTAATDSTIEGNAGLGVRKFNDDRTAILGFYSYIDQRRTEYDNNFTQFTVGSEWLAENWEARANAYIPLSGKKQTTRSAPTTFTLSGTSLVATGGDYIITEVPNYGGDFELGVKLPLPEYDYLKNIWGFIGGYRFASDETESITGYRLRAKADVTDKLSIGAEWRQDNVRDDEFLVEARLRFPFGGSDKKKEPPTPMYKRLTQQPVRDVDIVVQGAQTLRTTSSNVLSIESGTRQRILSVNNTAAAGGDGTTAHPYNTLAAAKAAATAGDIIYVQYGDGTSTGMDSGLTLDLDGLSLVGSGSALTYDSSRMSLGGAGFSIPNGTVIISKGSSPVLTNTTNNSDILTITADDILVSGVTLDSAKRYGVNISVSGVGNDITGTTLRDVNILSSTNNSIYASATSSALIDGLTLDNITTDNSGAVGVALNASGTDSTIRDFVLRDSTISESHTNGFQAVATGGGDIVTPTIQNTDFVRSGDYGIYFQTTAAGSTLSDLMIDNVDVDHSGSYGIYLLGQNTAQITNPTISNSTISYSGDNGLYMLLQNAGTAADGLSVTDSTISRSALTGLYVQAQAGTSLTNSDFSDLTLTRNYDNGLYLLATGASALIDQTQITNVTSTDSGLVGGLIQASTTGQVTNATIDNFISTGSGSHGLQIYATGSSATIDNVTVTDATVSDSRANGVYVQNASTGVMTNLTFAGLNISDSSDYGMVVSSTTSGSLIDNLDISDLNVTDTGQVGLYVNASTAGQITNTTIADTNVTNAGTQGVQLYATGTAATIDNLSMTNTTIDDAGGNGAYILATSTGVINNLGFAGLNVSGSSDNGVYFLTQNTSSQISNFTVSDADISDTRSGSGLLFATQSGSTLSNGTMTNLDVDGAGDRGVYANAANSGTVLDNLSFDNVTVRDTAYDGYRVYAASGSSVTNIDLSNATITDAGENGIHLQSTTSGSVLTGLTLTDVSVSGSALTGVYIQGTSAGELSVALENVTSTANHDYGVYVDDDTTSPFTVDMGGGALASAGGNRVYSNYLQEIRVDYDGGNLVAQNNWWGDAAGLSSSETTLDVSSTIDTTGFLTVDPGI